MEIEDDTYFGFYPSAYITGFCPVEGFSAIARNYSPFTGNINKIYGSPFQFTDAGFLNILVCMDEPEAQYAYRSFAGNKK